MRANAVRRSNEEGVVSSIQMSPNLIRGRDYTTLVVMTLSGLLDRYKVFLDAIVR